MEQVVAQVEMQVVVQVMAIMTVLRRMRPIGEQVYGGQLLVGGVAAFVALTYILLREEPVVVEVEAQEEVYFYRHAVI
jgi:hypothetical protein